jgi:predicted SAM-dependent methyltransferase
VVQNRLIIGAGIHKREGWMTLDADPETRPDFLGSIPPFPASVKAVEWNEIEWIHGITSLYPWDARQALTELYEMLKPGGRLTLEQPDFEKAKNRVEWLFGDAESFQNPLLMNRWSYSPRTLTERLEKVGFTGIRVLPAQYHLPTRDFRIEAHKEVYE